MLLLVNARSNVVLSLSFQQTGKKPGPHLHNNERALCCVLRGRLENQVSLFGLASRGTHTQKSFVSAWACTTSEKKDLAQVRHVGGWVNFMC
jgi:hypothetical protein